LYFCEKIKMSRKHFSNKGDKSPLLLLLGIIFLFGAIFSFFKENKKEHTIKNTEEPNQNPKDFI
jgi:hypothetical protein